jgi:hypothetical protein
MKFIAASELVRRSESELGALLAVWNRALARAKPCSEEWKDALLSVDNIIRERTGRLDRPMPRLF